MRNQTKPTTSAALAQIMSTIKKDSGTEIIVTENGANVSWENLHVNCGPSDISKATAAIVTLQSLGAYFV